LRVSVGLSTVPDRVRVWAFLAMTVILGYLL
jgi:hypothetical protein